MSENKDRRMYPRIAASLPATLSGLGASEKTSVVNLSKGGAFVETQAWYPAGELVELEIFLPNNTVPVCISGYVRRFQLAAPKGVGIEFLERAPGELRRLGSMMSGNGTYRK